VRRLSDSPIMFRDARARLALRYSLVLCGVVAVVMAAVYFAAARSLDVDPPKTSTVVESSPPGSPVVQEEVDTQTESDVEGLANEQALHGLRFVSEMALLGLLGTSIVVAWLVAGRVLRPIEDTFAAQRRFVQDASHELRNPLAVMRTSLDVALEDADTSAAAWRDVGSGVRDTVDRMSAVVDELLRTVRDDVPKAHTQVFDPADILRSVGGSVSLAAKHRKVTTVVAAEPGQVDGDPAAIQRVVANLLDNALRYAPTGSTVRVSGTPVDRAYDIRVHDDGAGIGLAEVDAVFERGRRDPDSPGLGLGLAIARDIVTAHRGEIDLVGAESPGAGTTVRVRLPMAN
jgi:signal transduction histidine kinase